MNELISEAAWRRIQEKYGITGSPADFILDRGWIIGRWPDSTKPHQKESDPPFQINGRDFNACGETFEAAIELAIVKDSALAARSALEREDRIRCAAELLAGVPIARHQFDSACQPGGCIAQVLRIFYNMDLLMETREHYAIKPAPAKEAQ